MNKQAQLEKSIKAALLQGVETLEADPDCLEKIKCQISTEKEGRKDMMKRIYDYLYDLKFRIKKHAALVCGIAAAAVMLCIFIQPVRVLAQEGIDKVASMVYIVVKGENGKYEPVQVPVEKVERSYTKADTTVLNDEELAKEVGFDFKAPQTLEGGYKLADTAISQTDGSDKKEVSKFYQKEKSRLVLSISDQNYSLQYAREIGDKRKEVQVENKILYYCERPLPVYPIIEKNGVRTNDPTQKPTEIKTIHSLAWEYNGVYYKLSDMGAGLQLDELQNAAKSVLRHQL
ncbi:hypothetical protein DCCM_4204 [Desulfocucumis palustris]|uniref:DUF4367 domain-containing protein n=1 Tax=Desulfocucumis palustris TaxID=1898651 RepID=A0A2L2XMA6_9FIRM|nr:hypothetical protein [Desulfocucumis palustris]GBF35081.1 hypothetical protein DCCM_4204 [Desulfocucumis palustris]